MWEACNLAFDRLPLAAIVDKKVFCVHGGIPRPKADQPDTRLSDMRKIACPINVQQPFVNSDPEAVMAFCMLWSDPADAVQEGAVSKVNGFGDSSRGSGSVVFGNLAVEQFLKTFKLSYIMRAHEATASGVSVSKSAKVLTVFSTSKDHGCGLSAKCGVVLIDGARILAITRSPEYAATPVASVDTSSKDWSRSFLENTLPISSSSSAKETSTQYLSANSQFDSSVLATL